MDFCPALDMANICIQLQATLNEQDKIDYPAWVQAIGTIVALGVAIAIPYFEYRRRSREASKKENLRLNVLASLFTHIEGMLNETLVFVKRIANEHGGIYNEDLDKLDHIAKGLLERLKQVSISDASDATQVYFILELEHGLSQVGNYCMEAMDNLRWGDTEEAKDDNKQLIARVKSKVDAAKALKEMFLGAMVKV
jgi:hypothetical protein